MKKQERKNAVIMSIVDRVEKAKGFQEAQILNNKIRSLNGENLKAFVKEQMHRLIPHKRNVL